MTAIASANKSATARMATQGYPAGSSRFDWAVTGLSAWIVGGLYLDGWAHHHGRVDDVFFTPWHAILYSGVLVMLIFLVFYQARGTLKGYALGRSLPRGYLLSLAGAALFLLGGLFDFVWHTLFGIEVNIETLLSPTHLFLATSGVLMISGPMRAASARLSHNKARGWKVLGPLVLCAALVLSIMTFFTQFMHPISQPTSAKSLAIASLLFQSALLMGMVLMVARDWTLPPGALTLMLTLNGLLMSVFNDQHALALPLVGAGLIADLLLWRLKPSAERPGRFYLFAFIVPFVFCALYFLVLQMTRGIDWTIHLWLGAIVMAGIAGLFAGFLAVSPSSMAKEGGG